MNAPTPTPMRIQRHCASCGSALGPQDEPEMPLGGSRWLCPECTQEAEMMTMEAHP